jgi:hypothetical protein
MIATLIAGQLATAPEDKRTADGRSQVVTSVRARLGRESVEGWQVIGRNPAVRNALLRLKLGEYVSVQGVPCVRTAKVQGETIVQRILHAEHVMSLRVRLKSG